MILLKSILIVSVLCFTPDENAGKEKESKRIEELKKTIAGEDTIVEVTIFYEGKESKVFLANCTLKQGRFSGQIVKLFGKEFIISSAIIGYSQDSVKSVRIIKKKKS